MAFKVGMIVYSKGLITPKLYRIAELTRKHADLKPMSLGTVPMQLPLSDLRRYRIRSTDEVSWQDMMIRVIRPLKPRSNDLFHYEVDLNGRVETVPENEMEVHEGSLAPDPGVMLAHLDLSPWRLAAARQQLLESFFRATSKSLGIVGYNGARMLPIPHQINAARYALQFGRTRFLLADEVGLGKTIEAGLITATLRKYFPEWQVGVFVPESLTAQWAFEMYGKFGKMIFALEMDEYDVEEQAGVILPHYKAKAFAQEHSPEILIVDEAHRTLRDEKSVRALAEMSERAHAVLLLTATPVSDESGNLLKLLRMLDPEIFQSIDSPEALRSLQDKQAGIEETLKLIREPQPDAEKVEARWRELAIADQEIDAHLLASKSGPTRHELHKMAALIVDRYYPGARIIRYRRKFLSQENAMPFRIFEPLEYKVTGEEDRVLELSRQWLAMLDQAGLADDWRAQRLAASMIQAVHSSPLAFADWIAMRSGALEPRTGVTADPIRLAMREGEEIPRMKGEDTLLAEMKEANDKWLWETREIDVTGRQLVRSPRFQAFMDFLQSTLQDEPDAHILVFTSFEANVHPMWLVVRKALSKVAETLEMSGPMARPEREKAAFEFQETPGGCVLISDELGGEGRNFQFATHIVHYDLPLAPWMVEQRIGRCDRVGRDEELDVDSQVLVAKGQMDEAFCDFLADGAGVFNESIAPVEGDLDPIMTEVMTRCIREGASGVLEMIDEVHERLEKARERENAELLARSAVGVEEAKKVSAQLNDAKELQSLREDSIRYARAFESMVDEQEGGRVAITVGEFHSLHAVPGVRSEMIGYYDRKSAVRHERLDFFSPGHPFIRTLTQMAMSESPDRAAVIERDGIPMPALVCLFRVSLPSEFVQRVRELPKDLQPPLLSKSAALFPTEMQRLAISLEGELIENTEENSLYYEPFRKDDVSFDEGGEKIPGLPPGWETRCLELAAAAQEIAEEKADTAFKERSGEFEDTLVEAMVRVNEDHDAAESDIQEIMEVIAVLTVELDSAVYMIPKGYRAPVAKKAAAHEIDEEDEDDLMEMLLDNLDD